MQTTLRQTAFMNRISGLSQKLRNFDARENCIIVQYSLVASTDGGLISASLDGLKVNPCTGIEALYRPYGL